MLRPRVFAGDGTTTANIATRRAQEGAITAITKWIPIEVIAFYEGITTPFGNGIASALGYAILAGMVVTVLWIAFATSSARAASPIAWRQVILSTIAFLFWAVGTTSPDTWKVIVPEWSSSIGPAVLAAGAIMLPIGEGILRRIGVPQD